MKIAGFAMFVLGVCVAISFAAKLSPVRTLLIDAKSLEARSKALTLEAATDSQKSKILSAEAAALKAESEAKKNESADASIWPTSLTGFGGGMALCAVGLVLWWMSVFSEREVARAATESDDGTTVLGPAQLVARIQQPLRELAAEISILDGPELCQRVEALNDGFVAPLADGRQRFVDRFGLAGGSEALNATAFGERMLNRVWSAAADGHLEEARSSFEEAVGAFAQAEEIVTRLLRAARA